MTALLRAPTREYRTVVMDSHRWDGFEARPDDIVVATYSKCGTTWTQRIVDLLVFQSPAPREFLAASPWIDATFFAPKEVNAATLAAQTHRRYVKTHLPFDAVPLFEGVKYIHTVRDGRDSCMSMHNHQLGFKPEMRAVMAEQAKQVPGLMERMRAGGGGPMTTPEDPREYFLGWMAQAEAEQEGTIGVDLPYFDFENTYWRERRQPYLLYVHYNDLKEDLAAEMRRISDFLEIDTPERLMPELVRAASFESMKRDGEQMMPQLRMAFDRGADRFINKGTNGRWKDVLTAEDLERYEALMRRKLSPAAAAYNQGGRLAAGDPRQSPD